MDSPDPHRPAGLAPPDDRPGDPSWWTLRPAAPMLPQPSVRVASPPDLPLAGRPAAGQLAAGQLLADLPAARPLAVGRPKRPNLLVSFVRRHGWRVYAVPILTVVTIVALLTNNGHSEKAAAIGSGATTTPAPATPKAPPTASGDQDLKTDAPGAGALNSVLQSDALPAGADYTLTGAKTFAVIPGTGPVVGSGPLRRYSIEVENGITGIDVAAFATTVQQTLSDARSWTGSAGSVSLQRADSGAIDFRVTLTSAMTVRTLCGYDIPIETSCYAPKGQGGSPVNRVVINDARWVRGDAAYIADTSAYRVYMINHETGHALGHLHAHTCLADGLAPVMMQQTIGLKTTSGQICQANPWPLPPGATDAPGAEAADTQINNEFNLQNE